MPFLLLGIRVKGGPPELPTLFSIYLFQVTAMPNAIFPFSFYFLMNPVLREFWGGAWEEQYGKKTKNTALLFCKIRKFQHPACPSDQKNPIYVESIAQNLVHFTFANLLNKMGLQCLMLIKTWWNQAICKISSSDSLASRLRWIVRGTPVCCLGENSCWEGSPSRLGLERVVLT